jgi:MFS family permease
MHSFPRPVVARVPANPRFIPSSKQRPVPPRAHRIFYGWWIVVACLIVALVGNALGLFGVGVYLHALTHANGWPISVISGAATLFYVVSAVLLIPVGSGITRFGPRPVVGIGCVSMARGVAAIGRVTAPWEAYPAFVLVGAGWACLSTTAVATTLAPWFEKYQGRAVSIASLGASTGGMIGAPVLLFGIATVGLSAATVIAGLLTAMILLPLVAFVLRHRPEEMGLVPDGEPAAPVIKAGSSSTWTRKAALRSNALRGLMISFGFGMMVQIGFLTHQVTLLSETYSGAWISATVSATAVATLFGRLALARFADQLDARLTAAVMLVLAAGALAALALFPNPLVLVGASILFGLTVGNVTTFQPIIVRQEFGAASFGPVFGIASCGIQLVTALGPGFYGLLHDMSGGYRVPLLLAGVLDVVAAIIVVSMRR